MSDRFERYLRRVTVVHAGILLALVGTASLRPVLHRKEIEIPIMEFTVDVRPAGPETVEDIPPVAEPEPLPEPEPPPAAVIEPEPVKPPPKPPEPPKKKPIEVSRKRVTRRATKATTPTPLSPEEIKRLMDLGATAGTRTVIPSEEARCFKKIYDAFYEAWAQPSKTEVGDAVTQTRIRLGADGTILSRSVTEPSGSAVMDSSVRRALNTVLRIEGLSREFVESHPEITVGFKVQ
jgi:outer membrane biosynthesis protein TonB